MLSAGTKIDRYELVALLGEGGMAEVWAARQEGAHGFKKLFALKAIHARLAGDPQFHKMFLDEARIASEIEHLNVAQVFDLGEKDGIVYLVMEYVDGESLAAILGGITRNTGTTATVPIANALRIVADVCAGLNAAHKLVGSSGTLRGVVHRDVSPQNVLLSVKGDVKLIDFGIAHAQDRVADDTGVDALKGKLRYMAPEQARREPIGPFTDVWAAGALLYRMLGGHPPFEAPTEVETMRLLLSGAAPTPLPEGVPPLVTAIVERAMAPDPGDRYASAAEMQTALEGALRDERLVPALATWVRTNLSDRYRARREALVAREAIAPSEATEKPAFSFQIAAEKELPFAQTTALATVPSLVVPEKPAPPPPVSSRNEEVHITLQSQPDVRLDAKPEPRRLSTPLEVKITRSTNIGPKDDEPEAAPRSFMDVRAIQAERVAEAEAAVGEDKERKPEGGGEKASPKAPKKSAAQLRDEQEAAAEAQRKKRIAIGGVLVGLVLLAVVALLVLPSIVKSRVLAAGRAAGVELTIGDVSAGMSGGELRNVTAHASDLPGIDVTIAEVRWTGLIAATEIRVIGVDVKSKGDLEEAMERLRRFYEGQRGQLTPAKGSRRLTVASVHVLWSEPFGAGSRLDAGDVGAEIDAPALGAEELHVTAGRFDITTAKTVLGPWSGSVESSPRSTRVRLLFDPLLPDGPNAVYMWGPGTKPHLTVKIPRTTFAQLGLRPQELGLPVEPSSDVEIRLDGGPNPNGRVDGSAKIDVFGVRVPGWKTPVDVKVEGAAAGPSGHPLDLQRTVVTVGPFTAFLNGTVTPHDRGLRLDATWKTQPILCERLARAEAKSLGTFAATLQEIAHNTGAIRVTGSAYATGSIKGDTAAPEAAKLTFQTRETCGVSLFGQP